MSADEAKKLITDAVMKVSGDRAPPDLKLDKMPDVKIHTIDIKDSSGKSLPLLGIPKSESLENSTSITDQIPALGKYDEDVKILHIYVTKTFYDTKLSSGTVPTPGKLLVGDSPFLLMLAELIDHEYSENVLGLSHREAAARARYFAEPGHLSPYHEFIIKKGILEFLTLTELSSTTQFPSLIEYTIILF